MNTDRREVVFAYSYSHMLEELDALPPDEIKHCAKLLRIRFGDRGTDAEVIERHRQRLKENIH